MTERFMQARLIVKNFGPIEDVNLDLRNVNVFIGPQASGKSALAKIYTICKSPLSFLDDGTNKNLNGFGGKLSNVDRFKKMLDDYNVGSFLNNDTYVSFSSELHDFEYSKEGIVYDRKIFKKIGELEKLSEDLEGNLDKIYTIVPELYEKLYFFQNHINRILAKKTNSSSKKIQDNKQVIEIDKKQFIEHVEKLFSIENRLSTELALYIPSERNFITIIKGASLNLQNNNVPIPKHILSFGAEFETASDVMDYLDLNFLKEGLRYENENGIDKIYYSENKSVKLTEAASGIQSVVPLLIPILYKRQLNPIHHMSFIIEEPELNLFPAAQYELIKLLEVNRLESILYTQDVGTIHIYTSHSPYILSTFNNFLYAYHVWDKIVMNELKLKEFEEAFDNSEERVKAILPVKIDPKNFSAYQICDGKAESIFNREKGLIEDNYIDEVTDKMGDDFDALMELMEEA